MDFKIGDKIYKLKNGEPDKTIVYEIKEILKEQGGNWHDGYDTTWSAMIESNQIQEKIVIKYIQCGSYTREFIVKIESPLNY